MIIRTSLLIHFKSKNFWFIVVNFGWKNDSFRVMLKENMRKASSKISSININTPKLRQVYFLTPWTKYLES